MPIRVAINAQVGGVKKAPHLKKLAQPVISRYRVNPAAFIAGKSSGGLRATPKGGSL